MNDKGNRAVYIPKGEWISLFSGDKITGPEWLSDRIYDREEMPVFIKSESTVPIYPERVVCTDDMDIKKVVHLIFDRTYKGIAGSLLGELCDFTKKF